MCESVFWSIVIQYVLPILLIGLGVLALVLIILAVVILVDTIKEWIKEWRD